MLQRILKWLDLTSLTLQTHYDSLVPPKHFWTEHLLICIHAHARFCFWSLYLLLLLPLAAFERLTIISPRVSVIEWVWLSPLLALVIDVTVVLFVRSLSMRVVTRSQYLWMASVWKRLCLEKPQRNMTKKHLKCYVNAMYEAERQKMHALANQSRGQCVER